MLESGTTTVVDSHYLHHRPGGHDGIARACLDSGIRAILCRAAMDSSTIADPYRETPQQATDATERFMERWQGAGSGRILVRPEAMNEIAASRELILALRALSRETEAGFHMHVSEARSRPGLIKEMTGYRTIAYLERLGVLGPDAVLAHCVWLDDDELGIIADSDTAVVHNPVSNQFLADGVARVPRLGQMGVRIGLGTDGAASNNSQNMFEVIKSAALIHKVHNLQADLMNPMQVLEMATIEGAKALGISESVGSLERGKQADIVLLNLVSPGMVPCYSLVSNLVFGDVSRSVDTVVIDGKIVVEDGRCTSMDRDMVLTKARALEQRIRTLL
jgi:5-methylthioadenosine/S-adenosylhomocysteine deaminase